MYGGRISTIDLKGESYPTAGCHNHCADICPLCPSRMIAKGFITGHPVIMRDVDVGDTLDQIFKCVYYRVLPPSDLR